MFLTNAEINGFSSAIYRNRILTTCRTKDISKDMYNSV